MAFCEQLSALFNNVIENINGHTVGSGTGIGEQLACFVPYLQDSYTPKGEIYCTSRVKTVNNYSKGKVSNVALAKTCPESTP